MPVEKHIIDGKVVSFLVSNEKDYIQNYHHNGKFYERDYLELAKGFCSPDKVFVDVGANVGNHTLFVSLFCPVLRVIPFECNPEALLILRENIKLNACSNVDTRHLGLALGSTPGFARIESTAVNNLGGTQIHYCRDGELGVVPGDAVLLDEPVGLIKIDVELTEFDVLEGLAETIGRWRPTILVEVVLEKHDQLEAWCEDNSYSIKMKGWDNLLVPMEASSH